MKLDTGTELPDNLELTKEFKDTFNLINDTNTNLFITGKAGSGKSTLLEYFRQNTKKNFVTLAFQGITAIKAKGQTLHSFFKFPLHFISKQDIKILKDKELLNKLDTILIDEISLVKADLFDAIDISLKMNRGNDEPFGGVQIIVLVI
jgi:ABC-type lipoprotein export system ATPase subunit